LASLLLAAEPPADPPVSGIRTICVEAIKDKRAFFKDVAKNLSEVVGKKETSEPLRKVVIRGDRARGVVTRYTSMWTGDGKGQMREYREYHDSPIYFARSGSSWRLDHATAAENEQDARKVRPGASR
jgi:hypothetical protein